MPRTRTQGQDKGSGHRMDSFLSRFKENPTLTYLRVSGWDMK